MADIDNLRLLAVERADDDPMAAYALDGCADEIERLRYVLGGVRDAIKTGRNEAIGIWKEQIDIALGEGHSDDYL